MYQQQRVKHCKYPNTSSRKNLLIALFLPVTILSNQAGVTMQNSVTTTGNSEVHVESKTNQTSNSTVNVSENSVTTNNQDSKTHTKMEITVNGKTKSLETDDPGLHTLELNDVSKTTPPATSKNNQMQLSQLKGETISIKQYITETIQRFFRNFFSKFSKK